MLSVQLHRVRTKMSDMILAVPVRIKIAGIMILPVLILGLTLNYWVISGLSDWLSWLLTDVRVHAPWRLAVAAWLLSQYSPPSCPAC